MNRFARVALIAATMFIANSAFAADTSAPAAEPVLERPTLRSLGAYWFITGDDNKNATITLDYQKAGEAEWHHGPNLFRLEKGLKSSVKIPEGAWLFAGSALLLEPNTAYELKLTLKDPDGGEATKTLAAHTISEPVAPKGPMKHVVPGNGGGTGTQVDPFKGIAAADKSAKPGDTFLLHAGVYTGSVTLKKHGEKGKPIVWRGAGDGEAIIDGEGASRAIQATGLSDLWFENLTIRNATNGIVGHEAARLVVRRCHLHHVDFGVNSTKNSNNSLQDYFIVDNVIEGPSVWPRSKGIEDARGIQLSGAGHVVAYNRIRGFGDAMDTFQGPHCEAIDFHNNDCSECTDDGSEMDYSYRNTRNFENRYTNVFQGVSVQPIYGGPVYVFRNVFYNVGLEPFKMHNEPSGALMIHNTIVKKGMPITLNTNHRIGNCVYRNNLFIGTTDKYALDCEAKMVDCDFDYDGFGGGPFNNFMKWNRAKYANIDEVHAKAPAEKHAVHITETDKVFAAGTKPPEDETKQVMTPPDLRLAPGTPAIDAGQPVTGFDDGFSGAAPDLGAYELGAAVPHYGPRTK